MRGFIAQLALITLAVLQIGALLVFVNKDESAEEQTFGDAPRVFLSSQVGTDATVDYILSTNGATSTWIANSGGGSEGGSGLWEYDSGTDTLNPIIASTSNTAIVTGSTFNATSTTASSTFPIIGTNYVDFATDAAHTALIGELTWNTDEGTLDLGLNGGEVINQLGQETVAYVRADEDISNGNVVYASSAIGASGRIGVSKFIANNTISSKFVIGVATEDTANGNDGYVTILGKVRGITTDGSDVGETWVDGTVLYASSTGAGLLTNVEPMSPNQVIPIAFVISAHATNGTLMVRQPDTYNIGELHDVFAASPSDKDALLWDNSNSRWASRAIATADISDLLTFSPTWTGLHTFTATTTVNNSLITNTKNLTAYADFYNGTFLESFDATTTSDGADITVHLANSADSGDLTMRFSTGDVTLSAPTSTLLTAGTDASPTENFVYITESEQVLAVSTSNWPATEHIKISYFLAPSATFVQSEGMYVNQNWNDHAQNDNDQGHMSHIGEKIRRLPATYFSGVDANGTDSYLTPTASNVELKSTSGIIYQMHKHTYPAVDTSTGSMILVKNWSGDPYHNITNLFDIVDDSTGTVIGANKFFNLVIWGVANKTGQYEPMMINLPGGSYNTQSGAENDTSGFDDLSIPMEFRGESSTGFLVARLTIQMGTTWNVVSTVDLRGLTPVAATGGTAAGVQVNFADNQFTIFNVTDGTKIIDFDASAITTANTRTITMPDYDVTLLSGAENETITGEWAFSTGTTTVANLDITTAVSILGEYFTNFTTYVRSLFTGGNHVTITNGDIDVDFDLVADEDITFNTAALGWSTNHGATRFTGTELDSTGALAMYGNTGAAGGGTWSPYMEWNAGGQFIIKADGGANDTVNLTGTDGVGIQSTTGGGYANLKTTAYTSSVRNIEFPDKAGTIAFLSDLYADTDTALYISGSSTIPHIGGNTNDILYWTGGAWATTATSSATLGLIQESDLHDEVTITGEDFLSLSGQQITANAINADNLSATNFGSFTCNGTTCTVDDDAITPDMTLSTGQTDEYCLTYEATGTTWEWQTCGGGGGSISGWATSTSQVAGELNLYTTNDTDIVNIGGSATTSSWAYFDPNIEQMVLQGSAGTSTVLWGAVGFEWLGGTYTGDTDFLFASSTGAIDALADADKVWSADKGTNDLKVWQGLTVVDDITMGGDTISDFVGTGLTLSGTTLVTDLDDTYLQVGTSSVDSITTLTNLSITESQISDLQAYILTGTSSVDSITTLANLSLPAGQVTGLNYYTDSDVSTYLTTGTGLTEVGGLIDWDSGYEAMLTASSSNWNDFYDVPSTVITAGTELSWSGNTLNGTAHIPARLAGTHITLTTNTFDVDNDLSSYNDDLTHYLDTDVSSYLYGSTTRSDLYTAGTGLSWTGTTLNAEVQTSDLYTDADTSAYITSSTTVPSIACANGETLQFNTTGDTWDCGTGGAGDVTAAAVMTDNTLIKGDGGSKGIQDSGITISDNDAMAITIADTSNEAGLTINQNDTTNNPSGLEINNAGTGREFIVTNTDVGTIGSTVSLFHDSASPADNDRPAYINFEGRDDAAGQIVYGRMSANISDASAIVVNSGYLAFDVRQNSGSDELLRIGHDGNGNINGIAVGESGAVGAVSSRGNQNLILQTGNPTTGNITITDGANGNITLAPNGTGTTTTTRFAVTTEAWFGETASTSIGADGNLTVGGGDITLGATSILSGGDTASLDNIDAINDTTESTIETALDTLINLVTVAISTVFELVNGTNPTVDSVGEMALDTTDNQLLLADSGNTARVFATAEHELWSVTVASTSIDFISGGVLPMPVKKDGLDVTQYRCYVDGGTSVVLNLSDGTNDTETITCATTVTSDTDVATNSTFTADEKVELQFGTITGTVDYVSFTAYGYIDRE